MKKIFFALVFILSFTQLQVYAQKEGLFTYFFKPRPTTGISSSPRWELKPTVQIPALKITESTRSNAKIDATFLSAAGGGITLQRSIIKDEKNYSTFSWSPILILLNGDTSKDNPINISYCTTIGVLNNIVQLGVGYDLGSIDKRSRFFGLISLGFNITNN